MRHRQVTVIGSGGGDSCSSEAYEIGKYIAGKGCVLITGGRGGIMESASKGAREAGGIVAGIIPGPDFSDANRYCSIVIPTGIGHARNMINILSGDVVIALGGSWGTLSEIAFSKIFNKPLIICDFAGGFSKQITDLCGVNGGENTFITKKIEDVFAVLDNLLG